MKEKTQIRIFKVFWILYMAAAAALILGAMLSCSPKSNPADWRFHKETANKHHKIKAMKVIHCNRE